MTIGAAATRCADSRRICSGNLVLGGGGRAGVPGKPATQSLGVGRIEQPHLLEVHIRLHLAQHDVVDVVLVP